MLAGSWSDSLELESRTSAAVSFCTLRRVIRHLPGVWAVRVFGVQERLPVPAPVIDQVAAELLPLKVAVMVALPDADETEVTLKLALTLP
jgi:hypothetical protein